MSTSIFTRSTVFALSLSALGCEDSSSPPATNADASSDATSDANLNDAAGDAPSDVTSAALRFLTQTSAAMGQLPEGVALRDGAAYIGFAPTGQIMRVDASGAMTMYAQVPIPPASNPTAPNGYLLGLAFDASGTLFAAASTFGAVFMAGIYRVPSGGGTATLFARDAMGRMNFPNGIDFDATGNLFVTDSTSGSVFKISPDGATVSQWFSGSMLLGLMSATPCGPGAGFPLGANGIVVDSAGGNVYVNNTDKASLVRIPITATGAAGTAVLLVEQDCARLGGADGLTRGPDGALYVAANVANAITRVSLDGTNVSVIESSGLLDSPASIAFGPLSGASTMFITNAAFTSAQTPGSTPRPGLLVRAAP